MASGKAARAAQEDVAGGDAGAACRPTISGNARNDPGRDCTVKGGFLVIKHAPGPDHVGPGIQQGQMVLR